MFTFIIRSFRMRILSHAILSFLVLVLHYLWGRLIDLFDLAPIQLNLVSLSLLALFFSTVAFCDHPDPLGLIPPLEFFIYLSGSFVAINLVSSAFGSYGGFFRSDHELQQLAALPQLPGRRRRRAHCRTAIVSTVLVQ